MTSVNNNVDAFKRYLNVNHIHAKDKITTNTLTTALLNVDSIIKFSTDRGFIEYNELARTLSLSGGVSSILTLTDEFTGVGKNLETPTANLHVYDSTNDEPSVAHGVLIEQSGDADAQLRFLTTESAQSFIMGIDQSTTNDDFALSLSTELGTNNIVEIDGKTGDVTVNTDLVAANLVAGLTTPSIISSDFTNTNVSGLFYQRVGDIVSFSGSFQGDYNGGTEYTVILSVPIASTFINLGDVQGVLQPSNNDLGRTICWIRANLITPGLELTIILDAISSDTAQTFQFNGHYLIR